MKCALVIPAWAPEEIFSSRTDASQINYWQPLGTLYVAAALREAGHEVAFFNGAFLSREAILESLQEFAPRLVGLYATAFGWQKAVREAKAIKECLPRAFVVAGGPYPSAVKEKYIDLPGLKGAPRWVASPHSPFTFSDTQMSGVNPSAPGTGRNDTK